MSRPTTTASTNLSRSLSSATDSSFLANVYLSTSTPDLTLSIPRPTSQLTASEVGVSDTELLRQLTHSNDGEGDGTGDEGEYEDLESTEVKVRGGTKPLRVKKKKGIAVRVAQPKARRRRSTLSFPHSPSPRTPVSPRPSAPRRYPSATSTKSLKTCSSTSALTPGSSSLASRHPHATISRLFLSLPQDSPSPTIPHFISHSHLREHSEGKRNKKDRDEMKRQYERYSGSSLHLGLGKFGSYDPIAPGPSPPTSPGPSPTKRAFMITSQYAKKPLPNPPSPLTPSRAPRKAAQLLGAGYTANPPSYGYGGGKKKFGVGASGNSALNGKHFRPLPNSTLTEIERFFGDVPKKPSSKPSSLSNTSTSRSRSKSTSAKSQSTSHASHMNDRGAGDRHVGEGETVKHRGEDGSMWLDVEEEQEFAWLMSEIFALVPQPLPSPSGLVKHQANGTEAVEEEGVKVLYESEGDEGKWGMETFTSVLSLPKPSSKTSPQSSPKAKSTKVTRRAKASDDSFLDLDLQTPPLARSRPPLSRPFNISPSFGSSDSTGSIKDAAHHPWSLKHVRSRSNPTPTSPKLSISPPMPVLLPPPRISSRRDAESSSNGYLTASGSESDLSLSSSPPRIKNRPPPLTLPKIKPNSKLPILTATSPNNTSGVGMTRSLASPPTVSAPKTKAQAQPQQSRLPARPVPQSVPMRRESSKHDQALPRNHDVPSTPFVRPRAAPKPIAEDINRLPPMPKPIPVPPQIPQEEPMSFFEPITPTEPFIPLSHQRGQAAAGTPQAGGGMKKGWLKRVVRPLAGRV
ncbi:hypothetical protein IAU59_006785 [Kwoniella sp. CBS 9459]